MSDRGYIRLYRSIFAHAVFRTEAFTEREAWTWLLVKAAWKPIQVRLGEHLVNLDRGQVVGAVRFLAAEWGWSKGKVERYVERLKNETMLETKTGTGITIITICNYDRYQGGDDDDGTEPGRHPGQSRDAAGTEPGQGRDNIKELKKGIREEGEEGNSAPPALSLLPPDMAPVVAKPKKPREPAAKKMRLDPEFPLTEHLRQYAKTKRGWTDRFIEEQFEKWKNHHIGKGTVWEKWDRSWMTWVQNGFDDPRGGRGAVPNRADSAIQGMLDNMTEDDFNDR